MKKFILALVVVLVVAVSFFVFSRKTENTTGESVTSNSEATTSPSSSEIVIYKSAALGVTFNYPKFAEIINPCTKSTDKVNLLISEGPRDIFYYPEYYYDYDGTNCQRKVPGAITGEPQVRTIMVRDAKNEKEITSLINQSFKTTCVSSVKLEAMSDSVNNKVTIGRTEGSDEPCLNFNIITVWNSRLNKLALLTLGQDWYPFESGIADSLKFN